MSKRIDKLRIVNLSSRILVEGPDNTIVKQGDCVRVILNNFKKIIKVDHHEFGYSIWLYSVLLGIFKLTRRRDNVAILIDNKDVNSTVKRFNGLIRIMVFSGDYIFEIEAGSKPAKLQNIKSNYVNELHEYFQSA